MSFVSVAAGQPIRATHVQQFTNWLTAQKVDTPATVAATSTTEYTLTVRSQDGGTGLALNVLYGSASSPTTIATFNKSQIVLAAPVRVTGTTPLAVVQMASPSSGPGVGFSSLYAKTDGTLAYKTGTSASENVLASVANRPGEYVISDYGMTTGGVGVASANTLALQSLWRTVAAAGGGDVVIPPGVWPFTQTTLNHTVASTSSVRLRGTDGAALMRFHGTTGPFLDIANGSTSALARCGISNLYLDHEDVPTAGATIRVTNVQNFELDRVYMANRGGGVAPMVGLEVRGGSVWVRNSKLICREDSSSARLLKFSNASGTTVNFFAFDSAFEGAAYPSVAHGVDFSNGGLIDTVRFIGCDLKDFDVVFKSGLATGSVANFQMIGGVIDGSNVCVQFQPVTGATYSTLQFASVWMSGNTYNFQVNESNAGIVRNLSINGCYLTNATTRAIDINEGVSGVVIANNDIPSSVNGGGDAVIWIGGSSSYPSNVMITGNRIQSGNTGAAASLLVATSVTPVVVVGNMSVKKDVVFYGAVTGARVYSTSANAFSAT